MNKRAYALGVIMVLLGSVVAISLKSYADAEFLEAYGAARVPWLLIANAGGFAAGLDDLMKRIEILRLIAPRRVASRAARQVCCAAFTIDEIGIAYGAADVVLARAGGSVWELAAAGLPAVLVPGAFATGQHQEKNARWFAAAGGAVVVPGAGAERAPRVAFTGV